MKRLFITLVTAATFSFMAKAQSIGIGTKTPESSAVLDISSSNKGLLIPRVNLKSSVDNASVASPATHLMVFNTNAALNGGIGIFYNANTPAAPNWKKLNDISMPYYYGGSDANAVFRIENYSAAATSAAIKGYGAGQGQGLWGEAGNGTGVYAKSASGYALETNGKLKLAGTGQAPAQGKVLTSDANGNATWQGAVAFLAQGVTKQPINAGVSVKMMPENLLFDLSGNYNYNTKIFTAPVNGIYHFDVHSQWASLTDDMTTRLDLMIRHNGQAINIAADFLEINFNGRYSQNISIDYQLQAGDEVWPEVFQNSGDKQYLSNFTAGDGGNRFGGRLVVKL